MQTRHSTTRGEDAQRGFTVVELLIVIVVIGILAAIVIVGYNGVTKHAVEVSLKSDLQNAASTLELVRHRANDYPLDGNDLVASEGNTLDYQARSYGYCVAATNPKTNTAYRVKSIDQNSIEEGDCDVTVTTLAGGDSGVDGGQIIDGTGSSAAFSRANGLTTDGQGNVYVGDGSVARKVTSDGVVSTIAGNPTQSGRTDGQGAAARFDGFFRLTTSPSGVMYATETLGVRSITTSGLVGSFVGMAAFGYADGNGTAASFAWPCGIVVDKSNTMYLYDQGNRRVRKVSPSGVTTTLAGSGTDGYLDGSAATARFGGHCGGLAIGADNALYLADEDNRVIRRIASNGTVSTFAGNGTAGYVDGVGPNARFTAPSDLASDKDGTLYVVDGQYLKTISPAGQVATLAGINNPGLNPSEGDASSARFVAPRLVTVAPDYTVYVFDSFHSYQAIRKITQ